MSMSMSILQLKDYRPATQQPEAAPAEADSAAKVRKQLHDGFAAIVAVGLALSCLYVGGRIVNARRAHRTAPAAIRVASLNQASVAPIPAARPPASSPVVRPSKPKTSTASPVWSIVNPRPGERYLQVAAIPARTIDPFLEQLEAKGFKPVIAPCPTDGLYRILIGPYTRAEALADARVAVEAAGLQVMVREY
jgi:hypothetical protein